MQETVFHVLLEGRKVGPYDRRTIVGMRIKNALDNAHMLISEDGRQLTVGELVAFRARREPGFQPNRSGSYSLVQATYPASLVHSQGNGIAVPHFRDEIEVRVQTDVLRVAGRARGRFEWKERDARVKLPMQDIVHARVRGGIVDLWLRVATAPSLQRITLELFTPEAAGELVEWLPHATPWPGPESQPAALAGAAGRLPVVWIAVVGTALAVGGVMLYLLSRRVI